MEEGVYAGLRSGLENLRGDKTNLMLREELKSINSGKAELRKFGLTVGAALAVPGGIFFWLGKPFYPYLLYPGIALILLGLLIPGILKPSQRLWMAFAVIMGWLMSRVILILLYYLVLTPVALIARVVGKRFLELKWDRSQNSYWNYREKQPADKSGYEKQF